MRALFTRYYRQNKGFRTAELLNELRAAGMPDIDGFYRRYVDGRDSLPYETVFAMAGIAVATQVVSVPFVGVSTQPTPNGTLQVQTVTPGSAAEGAGVQTGDVITAIGDVNVATNQDWATEFRTRYRGKAGQPLTITVQRARRTLTLNTTVRERINASYTLSRVPNPTSKQAQIWQGLASGL
jgi:predicted metalloprotease with PDZ domain